MMWKSITYGLLSDDHLLNADDLGNVIRARFKLTLPNTFIDPSQQLRIHVVAAINACTLYNDIMT